MKIAFTTEQLDERDRIPYWVDVASKAFYDHAFEAAPTAFAGRLSCGTLDTLTLTQCDCGPCSVTRSRKDVARDDVDDLMLCIRLEGRSVFTQGDRTVVMTPGTVSFQDAGRPLTVDFLEHTRSVIVGIPRRLVQPRMSEAEIERVMSSNAPATGVAVDFIGALIERVEKMEENLHGSMANQLLDLVSLAFGADHARQSQSTTRANALRRLKKQIESHLSDPRLNPSSSAEGAGMSVRYANALLAEEGSSLERYIVQQRLKYCRRALEDPMQAHRMIGEIAFAWGFSDHSHFTRRFRDAFGMTPGACRQAAFTPHEVRRQGKRTCD
jgi:AraC family transcriptional regulator, positive regulator of tynA and feaB